MFFFCFWCELKIHKTNYNIELEKNKNNFVRKSIVVVVVVPLVFIFAFKLQFDLKNKQNTINRAKDITWLIKYLQILDKTY